MGEDEYEEEEVNGDVLGVLREVILVLGDELFSMRPSITDPIGLHDTVLRAGTLKQLPWRLSMIILNVHIAFILFENHF